MAVVDMRRIAGALLSCGMLLAGCGGGKPEAPAGTSASSGQVRAVSAGGMSRFAAARAADQVSFGATPALVNTLAQQGLDAWITAQFALPVTQMSVPSYVIDFDLNGAEQARLAYEYPPNALINFALANPDQLRMRVSWSLMQFIPVNGKVQPYGHAEHFNLLQRHAFGNYGNFLRELTLSPAMGWFLDNGQNRPTSTDCPNCAPNENYARELMQLFTLGVVKLNTDGTLVRAPNGKPIETYSQEDVEELAGALTGWRFAPSDTPLARSNGFNYGVPMVAETWAPLHDSSAKTILGRSFPAGRNASQELDTVVDTLMSHPNIAPFVSLRLIQNLVTSSPSPAYLGRVASVFRNDGQGVIGDMKAVIRAILTDAEARQGDLSGANPPRFGKFREPFLWYTGALRGLGCTANLREPNRGGPLGPYSQAPFSAASVFSFYLPTDRAPGSNLLAPEQKLMSASEFTTRLGTLRYVLTSTIDNSAAGCQVDALAQAFELSPATLADEISRRWFKGAMPPTLRSTLISLATGERNWASSREAALVLTQFALTSPFYGIIK